VVIDCAGLERAARFWTAVLGYITTGNPDGNEFCVLQPLPHPAQS
jgi:hypothetical protein